MNDRLCPLCGTPKTYDGDWLACACDNALSRTLTVREAAAYLCRSRGCIYHLINDGYLAAVRDSRPLLIRMITLKSYVTAEHVHWRRSRAERQAA